MQCHFCLRKVKTTLCITTAYGATRIACLVCHAKIKGKPWRLKRFFQAIGLYNKGK